MLFNTVYASEVTQEVSQQAGWQTMLPLLIVFAVMYFLVIRPQNKRSKEQQKMQSAIKIGNQILTSGGLIGRVTKTEEKELLVEFTQGQPIRVVRTAVLGVVDPKEHREAKNASEKPASHKKRAEEKNS